MEGDGGGTAAAYQQAPAGKVLPQASSNVHVAQQSNFLSSFWPIIPCPFPALRHPILPDIMS